MRIAEFRETQEKHRAEIIDQIQSEEKPDFDEPRWWEHLIEQHKAAAKKRRRKYPYILFKRIVKEMKAGVITFVPKLFELKVGVCHGTEGKVEQYCKKGMMVDSWHFPKYEDIAHQVDPHQNDGIVHLHSWQRKLAEERAPWAMLEAYLFHKKGDQDKYFEIMQKVKSEAAENQELKAKVAALEAMLAKEKKDDVSNTGKRQSSRKSKKTAEGAADNSQGSAQAEITAAGQQKAS